MTEPVAIVEISSALPGDVPVWVDVSFSFRSAQTKRGKQRLLDKSQAGTATFVFSNADRKFDPLNAASPLYAFLKPMRRIRLRATWNAVTYPVYDGYIDFIEQAYNGPNESTAIIAATDGFKRLESAFLPAVWEMTIAPETVKAWYRLDEEAANGVTVIDRSGNGYHGGYIGDVSSTEGLLTDDANKGVQPPSDETGGLGFSTSLTPRTLPWAIEFWMKAPRYDKGPTGFNTYAKPLFAYDGVSGYTDAPGSVQMYTRNADDAINVDILTASIGSGGVPSGLVRSSVPVFDDRPHHIVLVAEAGQTLKLYVDGVNVSTGATGVSSALTGYGFAFGFMPISATFDEIRIYEGTVPSAALIAAHYATGFAPWANDTPAVRIGKVLDLIGWPAADRSLSAEGSPLQATGLGGSALDHLLLIEETELGMVFLTADGKLKYVGRNDLITGSYLVSQAIFGDAIGEIGYTKMDGFRLSDDTVRNIIRRQREYGAEMVAQDATSIATYGPKSEESSGTQETTDLVALDRAYYLLAHFKDPLSHIDSLELEPRDSPATMFPIVLGIELGNRVTLRRRPQLVGAAIEQETMVQGVEHAIGPKKWTTNYYLDSTASQEYFLFDITLWDAPDWRFSA